MAVPDGSAAAAIPLIKKQIDLPLVAAHFFYYAGWADKLGYAFPGRSARPLGVAGGSTRLT